MRREEAIVGRAEKVRPDRENVENRGVEPQPWQVWSPGRRQGADGPRVMAPWRAQLPRAGHGSVLDPGHQLPQGGDVAIEGEQIASPDAAGSVA